MSQLTMTDLTRVRRHPERAHYDCDTLHALLDAGADLPLPLCWMARCSRFPTARWRKVSIWYIHGSNGSRMIRALRAGASVRGGR